MKMKLSNYLDKVEEKYIKARSEWSSLQKELKAEDDRFNNIKWANLSQQGRFEESENHKKNRREILAKLDKLRADFKKSADDIQTDSDKVFNRMYQFTAGDVDPNGVAILQNGALKDSELMQLAETYRKQGNYTMYFMFADKLKKDKDHIKMTDSEKRAQAYYENAQKRRDTREDHDVLEAFRDVCLYGLRDEDYLSNGVHNEHDGFYQKHRGIAEGIETDVSVPWKED